MADTAIGDLVLESALAAADEFVFQPDGTAATTAKAATFALMGGLEIDTTYNSAADHGNIAATAGKLYLVNTSALSTDDDFTLPVAANVNTGERVGVFITTGDDAQELDLKSGAALDLINGVDHSSTSWSRLFITGECVIFRCVDGATADWIVEYDGRIPQKCMQWLTTSASGESTSIVRASDNSGVWSLGENVGDISAATPVGRVTLRRLCDGYLTASAYPVNNIGSTSNYRVYVGTGATPDYVAVAALRPNSTSKDPCSLCTFVTDVAADDYFTHYFSSSEGTRGMLAIASPRVGYGQFSFVEVLRR